MVTGSGHAVAPEISAYLQGVHERQGVAIRLDTRVARIEGEGGKVTAVLCADGSRLPCDLVLAAVGAVPSAQTVMGEQCSSTEHAVLSHSASGSRDSSAMASKVGGAPAIDTHAYVARTDGAVAASSNSAACAVAPLASSPANFALLRPMARTAWPRVKSASAMP